MVGWHHRLDSGDSVLKSSVQPCLSCAPKLTLLCTVTLSPLSLYLGLFKIQLADPLEIHKWPPFSLRLFCFSLYMYIHAAAAAAAKSLQSCPTLCNPVKEQQGEIRKPSSVIIAKKQRKTIEWERLEISSRKLEIPREHFTPRPEAERVRSCQGVSVF